MKKTKKKKSSLYTNTGYGDIAYGLKMFNREMGNISSPTSSLIGNVGSIGAMTEDIDEEDISIDFILRPLTSYIRDRAEDEEDYNKQLKEYLPIAKLLNDRYEDLFVVVVDGDITSTPDVRLLLSATIRDTGAKLNKYSLGEIKFAEEIKDNCRIYAFPSHNYAVSVLKAYEDSLQMGEEKEDE